MADFTLAPRQILVNLVNATNPSENLVVEDINFGTPEVITENSRNTKITLTAKPDSPYDTSQTFYYNRMDLAFIFAQLSNEFQRSSVSSIADVIAAVNERFQINLTDEDYTASALPSGDGTVIITAKAGSLNYWQSGEIELVSSAPVKRPLAEAFPNNILDGLTYESPVVPQQ